MIQVKFFVCQPEGSIHMRLKGHAGYAPKGQDLVCAGASTLAYTLGEAMERMYHQNMLRRCPRIEIGEGRAEIIAVPKAEYFQMALLAFWVVESGMCSLGMNFPGFVRVEEVMRCR